MVIAKKSLLVAAGFAAAIAVAPHGTLQAQEQSAPGRVTDRLFDKPLYKQTLPLPPDPKEHGKGTLTCFYYPYLMIKEAIYEDYKGAGRLSITYLRKEKPTPPCQLDRAENERQIQDWGGYFIGVKDGYVFFDGDDGYGNGMPFAVYTSSGDRVFVDSGVLHSVESTRVRRDPGLSSWDTNPLLLRYRRSYLAPCSIRANEKACWSTIRRVTGLTQTTPPDCSAAYEAYEKAGPLEAASIRDASSFIDYDVETTLDDRGIIRITPIGPAGQCYLGP